MDEPTREELDEWDRQIVWHPFTQMAEYEPLILQQGEGCTVVDVDGNRDLDGTSSLWCNVHGHRHPRLDAAAKEQLDPGEKRLLQTLMVSASMQTEREILKRIMDEGTKGSFEQESLGRPLRRTWPFYD